MGEPSMRDSCGLLKDYWYVAARSEEVTARRPLGRVILGEMIVLWRTKEGAATAMSDRCLHRNALLSEGDLFDGCIGCPYHGWTYDAQGRCVNIPSEGPDGKAATLRRLETFPVREEDDLVWVWMGGGVPPQDRLPFRMPYWKTPGWGAYYMVTSFANGVTNLVENFMDVPHTVFVHRGWFRNRKRSRVRTRVERTPDSVLVTYDQPRDSIGFTELILNPKRLPLVHTDKFYMPNVTRVDYEFGGGERAFVITSACTPVSAFETTVYTCISYKLGLLNPLASIFLPFYTRQVIRQDVEIMEIQGRSLRHHGEPRFTSTPADTLHVHIEALRHWAESGGAGPRPEPTVEEMDFWI
jgi:phenylpropionate dioxygenase-like ring-hydroxylating dioxygenase large terminal subunit